MAKSSDVDIDMKEWEVLVPDDVAFLDFSLFSHELSFNPREVIRMDHFTCHPSEVSHVPLVLDKNSDEEEEAHVFKDIGVVPPVVLTGQNAVSVSEVPNKFEESPKSPPQNNEEEEEEEEYAAEGKKHDKAASCGVNIWGSCRASCGIGALCSIGVAAATICIFILGGRQRQQQQHHHQNQRLQFQIYRDDKRIKQVMQQATRLNQALSVVRGIPVTRANISFGGYYDDGL